MGALAYSITYWAVYEHKTSGTQCMYEGRNLNTIPTYKHDCIDLRHDDRKWGEKVRLNNQS